MTVLKWDGNAYPAPRRDRGAGLTVAPDGLPTLAAPRVRRVVFHIQSAAVAQQRTAVSVRLYGPAVVKRMEYTFTASNSVANQGGIHLHLSNEGGGQGAVAFPGPLPVGVSLFSTTFQSGGAQVEALRDQNYLDHAATARGPWTVLLDEVTQLSEFFLKLTWTNPGAASQVVDAILTVYERVEPELLPDLLG